MERVTMVKGAVTKVAAIEVVAIYDRSAMRDISVVVVNCSSAMPVVSPVMPAPRKSSEEAHTEPDSKSNPRTTKKDSRHGIPAWIRDDRRSVHEPRIVGRHVDNIRVGRLDVDRAVLIGYVLLLGAFQVASVLSLLTHRLHSVGDTLRVVGVGVAHG